MKELLKRFSSNSNLRSILLEATKPKSRLSLKGLSGSSFAFYASSLINNTQEFTHVFVFPEKDEAGYFLNDIEEIFGEKTLEYSDKNILFYPRSYKHPYEVLDINNANILLRAEVLSRLSSDTKPIIVTYAEALSEKVVSVSSLRKNILKINKTDSISMEYIIDALDELDFDMVDFVSSPGEYSLRGGIIDIYSYSNEYPYRVEFFGDDIDSLRSFDVLSQLTIEEEESLEIMPNIQNQTIVKENRVSLLEYFGPNTIIWSKDLGYSLNTVDERFEIAAKTYNELENKELHQEPEELYLMSKDIESDIQSLVMIEFGLNTFSDNSIEYIFDTQPQPLFNKKLSILAQTLNDRTEESYQNIFFINNPKQVERIDKIIKEFSNEYSNIIYEYYPNTISKGFIDHQSKTSIFTDHEIFERYHRYKLRDQKQTHESLTMRDLLQLKPGDFITHIDHGVGRFSGLEKIENNGKVQETIRLVYKDNDILYISIHALHKISRFISKDGTEPTLHRLGSNTWQNLKRRTKQKVKDIAKDLIALYAKRLNSKGFPFSADSYLQDELEASFIYEDTPDQLKATNDVKRDMENTVPMDRLICGDVGFGKTEIAIRAAFKAVADSKQVAVLVPTTILAFQHYKTFSERLEGMPCNIDYINRFRTAKEKTQIKKDLKSGKLDILIGTHAIANKAFEFKDLGLLIIDEEQKFGVAMKERLKKIRVNVDTLTLTATPIPRTLQFSLMGARDLSVINTPPANRHPIFTEIRPFDKELIRDAILKEISRRGQVFFVHNRVENIKEVAGMIQELVPDAKIFVAHGQMEGNKLERIMLAFIEGEADILVSTTIIENGLDIPRANTIIINDAQNYGLSDLHQLRGRVGRSNQKAYAYLLVPSLLVLTDEARKRLKAISEFSHIGSGFSIAMRDLDIRGAGNILGAEQSGFISEIGYEMYQKILNEAIDELKENEFKDLYKDKEEGEYVKDFIIETDLEILIPDSYVANTIQRLNYYKELDEIETEEDISRIEKELRDRFGKIPKQTQELIETVRLRRLAKTLGFERLIIKNNVMRGYFVSNKDSKYYSSQNFNNVLFYVQSYPSRFKLRESNERLSITVKNIDSIGSALSLFKEIISLQ